MRRITTVYRSDTSNVEFVSPPRRSSGVVWFSFRRRNSPPREAFCPQTRGLGYALTDLATAYVAWAFGTPPDVNPLLGVRCEQSPLDPRIWFLPASVGGELTNTCYVRQGTLSS